MKKILITGASGFLGSVIVAHLLKLKYTITKVGITEDDDIFCNLADSVPCLTTDFDWVIHVAGKAHIVPKSEQEIADFFQVNYEGTMNLIKGIEQVGKLPESIVYISTIAVYGLDSGDMINENHKRNPIDAYGKSKMKAEDFLLNWGDDNGVKIGIVRAPLIAGFNAPGNLGSIIKGIKSGYYLNINNGKAKRSLVLADDLASFLPSIAIHGGVFHLTDGQHPSYKEISDVINLFFNGRKICNIPLPLAWILANCGDLLQYLIHKDCPFNSLKFKKMTSSLTFDDSKARTIGWNPRSVIHNTHLWLG